jgi:hypothetical protein
MFFFDLRRDVSWQLKEVTDLFFHLFTCFLSIVVKLLGCSSVDHK